MRKQARILLATICLLILACQHALSQNINLADTLVLIEDCVRKTMISEGGRTTLIRSEALDCFWESGTDTLISIDDCIEKTSITKWGYSKFWSYKLDCFWDDAETVHYVYLVYSPENGKSYYSFENQWLKNGETKSNSSWGSLSAYHTQRLGLDKVKSDTIFPNEELRKEILIAIEQQHAKATISDTTLTIQQVLNAVNALRNSGCLCGDKNEPPAAPLRWDKELEQVAFLHAKDMYQRNYFSHDTPEAKSPFDRMEEYGVSFSRAGENIHQGAFDGVDAVYSWQQSPGHCRNMMNSSYTRIGVARYVDKYVMLLSFTR